VALFAALAEAAEADAAGGAGAAPPPVHLVIAPSSVLDNWARELARWCPGLRAVKYHGPAAERKAMRLALDARGFDVLVTSYTYFEGDDETQRADRAWLRQREYDVLVLDEAHALKRQASRRAEQLGRLESKQRLLLTGTPVQNNLPELFALLTFMLPQIFPPLLADAMREGSGTGAKPDVNITDAQAKRARKLLAPFVLRRVKSDVLKELQPKLEEELSLPMPAAQRASYRAILAQAKAQAKARASTAKGSAKRQGPGRGSRASRSAAVVEDLGRGVKRGAPGGGPDYCREGKILQPAAAAERMLKRPGAAEEAASSSAAHETAAQASKNLFFELRAAAMHPCLLRRHYASDAQLDTIAAAAHAAGSFGAHASLVMVRAELTGNSDFRLHQLCAEIDSLKKLALPPRLLFDSAKLKLLATLLPQLRADGHRALVFSQSTQMLDILQEFLGSGSGGLGLKHLRLDGSTPVAERQEMIDEFQRSEAGAAQVFCFLLSTRAGGQGINLTAADTVIIHDLDWNPMLDVQAEDRAHRIGQTREVRVIRLPTLTLTLTTAPDH
jgi:SWI/SNF-related matrix-associated actin-dependent regulator 1 of chromatin subfamily A